MAESKKKKLSDSYDLKDIRCPVCYGVKYWSKEDMKEPGGCLYLQCVKCWSIINRDELIKRRRKLRGSND